MGRVPSAREAERRRIAWEPHDEMGRTLTAVLPELKQKTAQAGVSTRSARVARRLPPGVLDELGRSCTPAGAVEALVRDHLAATPGRVAPGPPGPTAPGPWSAGGPACRGGRA